MSTHDLNTGHIYISNTNSPRPQVTAHEGHWYSLENELRTYAPEKDIVGQGRTRPTW